MCTKHNVRKKKMLDFYSGIIIYNRRQYGHARANAISNKNIMQMLNVPEHFRLLLENG